MGRPSKSERRRRRRMPTVYGCSEFTLAEAAWKPPALLSSSAERYQQKPLYLARRWRPPLPPMRPEDIW